MDALPALFACLNLSARVFYSGALCGTVNFDAQPGLAPLEITRPSLLFYPGPLAHGFFVDDPQGAQLVCASVNLGVGLANPLLLGLPPELLIPLADMTGIEPILDLLFKEAFAEFPGRQSAVDHLADYAMILVLRHAIGPSIVDNGALVACADPRLGKAMFSDAQSTRACMVAR